MLPKERPAVPVNRTVSGQAVTMVKAGAGEGFTNTFLVTVSAQPPAVPAISVTVWIADVSNENVAFCTEEVAVPKVQDQELMAPFWLVDKSVKEVVPLTHAVEWVKAAVGCDSMLTVILSSVQKQLPVAMGRRIIVTVPAEISPGPGMYTAFNVEASGLNVPLPEVIHREPVASNTAPLSCTVEAP